MLKFAWNNILKNNIKRIVVVVLLMISTSLISVGASILLMKIIDNVLPSGQLDKVIMSVVVYVCIAFLQSLVSYICSLQSTMLQLNSVNTFKVNLINKIFTRDGSFFTQNSRGELYQNVESDSAQFCEFIIGNLISVFVKIINLVISLVYLAVLDLKLLLLVILFQPLVFIFERIMTPAIVKISRKSRDVAAEYSTVSQEVLSNPIELIMSGYSTEMIEKLKKSMKKYLNVTRKSMSINMFTANAGEFLSALTLCAVIAYSGISIINDKMSIGILVVFINYTQRITSGITALVDFSIDKTEIEPIYDRVREQLEFNSCKENITSEISDTPVLVADNIRFSYDENNIIYKNFNFVFNFGSKYGIIGKTGEGKSTLVKLLFGLWKPNRGEMSIDGNPCGYIKYNDISSVVTYVSSSPIIFRDTIFNNITMFSSEIDENDVWDVLKKVELYDLFNSSKDKLDTVIGDNGVNLSSGQRQRISIARTMLTGKKIIVLDEPTSALDETTKKLITKLIYTEFDGKTIIIISHDTSILTGCDKILKIENGEVHDIQV